MNDKIYTPIHIIHKILKSLNIDNENIIGKKICDHSCGDGNFIIEIVKLIIQYSETSELEYNLSCVYGFDIDHIAVESCISKLNILVPNINWNIYVKNSLSDLDAYYNTFDYIVGNPPYAKIHSLDDETRLLLKNYSFCGVGNTDIYLAFHELSLKLIKEDGMIGMITPNSFMSNQSAKPFRDYMLENRSILEIHDFKSIKIFDSVDTYTAISIYKKQTTNTIFPYFVYDDINNNIEYNINFSDIKNKKFWNFNYNTVSEKYLKDICTISVGLATLHDKIFILPLCKVIEYGIENDILKPIIKASKYNAGDIITEYIIFPYVKVNNKYVEMEEEYFSTNFPNAYQYLLNNKTVLLNRDKGKEVKYSWYAFGRTQGLDTTFGEKIIFSPMNKKANFIFCNNVDATLYSGYFIKPKGNITFEQILKIINSDALTDYIENIGGNFGGGYKSYTKKVLDLFPINI